jgi:hypothetical protein
MFKFTKDGEISIGDGISELKCLEFLYLNLAYFYKNNKIWLIFEISENNFKKNLDSIYCQKKDK